MKISVIIPTSNRPQLLRVALQSIVKNNLSNVSEILVVENGTPSAASQVVSDFAQTESPTIIRYLFSEIPGLLTGRHLGIQECTGEVLCFLDDDVILDERYFDALSAAFSTGKRQLATGPSVPEFESDPPDWLNALWTIIPEGRFCLWLSLLDLGDKELNINPNFVWGLNMSMRRDLLMRLGGFHPDNIPKHLQRFQGDGETGLTTKASALGIRARYYPGLKVRHQIPDYRITLPYFTERAFYNGVAHSYADLRQMHLPPVQLPPIKNQLVTLYRFLRQQVLRKSTGSAPPPATALLKQLKEAEADGYRFHQEQFNTDQNVRLWVLKDNYWDYRLPR